jgi:serine phosphatase RsbU (regulator of sigma subunit)/PAS domain-containing protein
VTSHGEPGRCLLVDTSASETPALLAALDAAECSSSAELRAGATAAAGPVDLVVIGSLADSPMAVVQLAHRLLPDAAVAVLSADPGPVRREASYAPGVPLDLLVAGAGEEDVAERLRGLRTASADRRRHAAVLAAVARRATASEAPPPGLSAVGALLEHAPLGVLVAGASGELLGWNRRAEALLDLRTARRGDPVDALVPGAAALVGAVTSASVPGAAASEPRGPMQVRIADRVDVELTAVSSQTDQGGPVVLLLAADVTAHREAERERDRLAGQVELLARISQVLMESLDVTRSLSRLADAVVPAVADWVGIELRDEQGQLIHVLLRHGNPALAAVTREVQDLARRKNGLTELSRQAESGNRVLVPRMGEDLLVEHVPDTELRAPIGQLGMSSALAVPIPGRVGVLGSLLLARGPGGRELGSGDLALAVEIGRRAGIAVDNARLYAGQRNLATELQQSLLTAPPSLPFADIAVRYVAAAQEAQVGGDWYDSFRRRGGDLVVVIGDVVGHDSRAAAAMGQLRGLVRSIGFVTDDDPGQVLTSVDEAIEGLELSTIATAVVAELSFQPEADQTSGVRLRWSNAGHPPPVLLDTEGRAHVLEPTSGRADLMLGVVRDAQRTTEHAVLPLGSTLLLYTDGLIERRGQSLDHGLEQLLSIVRRMAGAGLDRLCDAILSNMVPLAGEDDVAIVAVRPRRPVDGGDRTA